MRNLLKQSTARNVGVFLVSQADSVTGATGQTLTITASKDGGAFGSISPVVTELANGWYNLALTTSHTDTLGSLLLHITSTGTVAADPWDDSFLVVVDLPGATVASVSGAVGSVAGAVGSVTGNVGGNVVGTVASVVGNVGGNVVGTVASVVGNVGGNVVGSVASVVAVVSADLTKILGTALTETSGQIAAAFKKFFNIASPTSTMNEITLVDTITTYTGNTLQTGDSFLRLGLPAGVSIAADLAEIEAETDGIAAIPTTDNSASIAAIKAKTDNLPSDPADESLVIAATDALAALIGIPVGASISADIAGKMASSAQIVIKKNTQLSNFEFPMTDSTTHAPKTSLTVTVQRSIDGGAYANCSNAAAEVGSGTYKITLSAADLNGSVISLKFTASGADTRFATIITQA